jgi:hypothetical protein
VLRWLALSLASMGEPAAKEMKHQFQILPNGPTIPDRLAAPAIQPRGCFAGLS